MLKSLKEYLEHFKRCKLSHLMSTEFRHICSSLCSFRGGKCSVLAGVSINDPHYLFVSEPSKTSNILVSARS